MTDPLVGNKVVATAIVLGATGGSTIVAPFYADMDASGATTLSVVRQQRVTMSYDLSFNAELSEADSAQLANAFVLSQDGSGNMVADISNNADFVRVMRRVVLDASDNTLKCLDRVLYDSISRDLSGVYGDAIANDLESFFGVSVHVDASGGATNLWEDMKADPSYPTTIAVQLPNDNYLAYCDTSENIHTNALPLLDGDKLVFLFALKTTTTVGTTTQIQSITVTDLYGASLGSTVTNDAIGRNPVEPTNTYLPPGAQSVAKKVQSVAFYVKVRGSKRLEQIDTSLPSANVYNRSLTPSTKLLNVRLALPAFANVAPVETNIGDISGNTGTFNLQP
jgi:adenylylsulfate kinase-like enzyme